MSYTNCGIIKSHVNKRKNGHQNPIIPILDASGVKTLYFLGVMILFFSLEIPENHKQISAENNSGDGLNI
jgi:hypothetical protein